MNRTHAFKPALEQLDIRSLPSVAFAADAFAVEPTVQDLTPQALVALPLMQPARVQQQLLSSGIARGTWMTLPTLPDTGTTQDLQGSGLFLALGPVQVSGTLHTPGFIRQGRTTGTLVLSNASGSITLQLVGPPQPGFSPPPSALQYTIVGGTGAYTGYTGHGTVTLAETSGNASTFSMIFTPT